MKFLTITLTLCCSTLAGEVVLNSQDSIQALLKGLSEAQSPPLNLPDENIVVVAPPTAPAPTVLPVFSKDTRAIIRSAARKHRVPAAFVKSIVAAESNFDPAAVSPKGAIGLMQLMPITAQQFGADPRIPEQNVDAGTRYLRFLIDRYHSSRDWLRRVIAAYNAGPAMVDRYGGVPPFPETRVYVARVLTFLRVFQRQGV
jgi:soluble lytic murein transglycosylase-like protein